MEHPFDCREFLGPLLERAARGAPRAGAVADWRRLLDSASIDAVVVATPTPAHRDIVLAALQAGKHACEAPIAASIEDARATAAAARLQAAIAMADAAKRRRKHVRIDEKKSEVVA